MNARHKRRIIATVLLGLLFSLGSMLLVLQRPFYPIPPHVQFQSSFSRQRAAALYASARHQLWRTHCQQISANMSKWQFSYAWDRLINGPGTIEGIVTDSNSNILACVSSKNGGNFWIRVVEHKQIGGRF